jgi:hypothetical protein
MLADQVRRRSKKEKMKCQAYFQDATSVGNFFSEERAKRT